MDLGEAESGKAKILCLARVEITNIPVLDPGHTTSLLINEMEFFIAATKNKNSAKAFVSRQMVSFVNSKKKILEGMGFFIYWPDNELG